jgi:ceramide glucosyltransferase
MTIDMPGLLGPALFWRVLLAVALLGTLTSTIFLGMVLAAARRYKRLARAASASAAAVAESSLPAVTILKPVHGMEPRLAENLESFFKQDYPNFEIIFGARDADNAALKVAEEVRSRYPHVKSSIVLSGPPTWPNAKVFSLAKMIRTSTNDYFVISDSDVLVAPEFLRNVVAPLLDPQVGLVTCPYEGIPSSDLWSSLEALGMSIEMPSGVMVADMMEGMRFAMGAVMATRRDALDKIGGIAATADYYSDDFVLGNEVWAAGYKVVLSHHIVGHVLMPRSFNQTFGDQLRWMKSTRYSRPAGHVGSGLTFAMPFGVLGLISAAALGHVGLGLGLFAAAFLNRVIQAIAVGWGVIGDPRALRRCWLYPLRDLMGSVIWMGSFTSRSFFWRGEIYRFSNGGKIIPQHRPATNAVANRL